MPTPDPNFGPSPGKSWVLIHGPEHDDLFEVDEGTDEHETQQAKAQWYALYPHEFPLTVEKAVRKPQ